MFYQSYLNWSARPEFCSWKNVKKTIVMIMIKKRGQSFVCLALDNMMLGLEDYYWDPAWSKITYNDCSWANIQTELWDHRSRVEHISLGSGSKLVEVSITWSSVLSGASWCEMFLQSLQQTILLNILSAIKTMRAPLRTIHPRERSIKVTK